MFSSAPLKLGNQNSFKENFSHYGIPVYTHKELKEVQNEINGKED